MTARPKCAVDPATVVACPSASDSACEAFQCNPKTGTCAMTPVHQGSCKVNSATVVKCPSGGDAACAQNLYQKASRTCAMAAVGGTRADPYACVGGDACLGGTCQGLKKTCDDGNACTQDVSNHPQGCSACHRLRRRKWGSRCFWLVRTEACGVKPTRIL